MPNQFFVIHDGSNILARGRTADNAWRDFFAQVKDGDISLSDEAERGELPIEFCYECAPCSESIFEDHSDDLSWKVNPDGVIVHDE